MKYLLISILVLVLTALTYGFYIKSNGEGTDEIVIGLSVLAIAFVFMPLFIYHRYKNKNMQDFTFEKFRTDLEERSKSEKL